MNMARRPTGNDGMEDWRVMTTSLSSLSSVEPPVSKVKKKQCLEQKERSVVESVCAILAGVYGKGHSHVDFRIES